MVEWTDEMVEKLRDGLRAGKTAHQISVTIGGVTKNAVIGKAHRLKLRFGGTMAPRTIRVQRRPVKLKRLELPRPVGVIEVPDELPKNPQPPTFNPPKNPERTNGDPPLVTLLVLQGQRCKYPVQRDDEGEWLFCNRVRPIETSYCKKHAEACFQPVQPRRHRARR